MTRALVLTLLRFARPDFDDVDITGWALLIGGLAIMAVGLFA